MDGHVEYSSSFDSVEMTVARLIDLDPNSLCLRNLVFGASIPFGGGQAVWSSSKTLSTSIRKTPAWWNTVSPKREAFCRDQP